jgi:hypothetical protein
MRHGTGIIVSAARHPKMTALHRSLWGNQVRRLLLQVDHTQQSQTTGGEGTRSGGGADNTMWTTTKSKAALSLSLCAAEAKWLQAANLPN